MTKIFYNLIDLFTVQEGSDHSTLMGRAEPKNK